MSRFNAHDDLRQRMSLQRQQNLSAAVASVASAGLPMGVIFAARYDVTYAQIIEGAGKAKILDLPLGWHIHHAKVKHSKAFGGGGIATYTVTVGSKDDDARWTPSAFDVFQAPGDDVYGCYSEFNGGDVDDDDTEVFVYGFADTDVADATKGAASVWLWFSAVE